ncbi:MAG: glycoside hydrolase family 9 protein [Acidobacteriales bacterium]|nr:glycoside hydrolase family 9 protein [Terriglobales bacterium]
MRLSLLAFCSAFLLSWPGEAQTGGEWPRRPLLEARYEDSMMYRYLSKPVHESVLLDDMETDRGWRMSGIGTLTYTTDRAIDGKRSLRFQTQLRDEAHLKANYQNGTFTGEQGGVSIARLAFDKPRDWRRFNRLSIWVYVHPASMRTYSFRLRVEWEGMTPAALEPNPSHHVQDLVPGKWQQVVWEIPDLSRERITSILISQTLRGHDPEDDGVVTYDFDRLELQRVDPEPYEGWEVAEDRIAYNHVGYRPSSEKLGIASAASAAAFDVVEASSGRVAASFPVKPVENARGRFHVLDFTSFSKPGRYLLRCGRASGRPFTISDDLWYETIEKTLNFFYAERCGFDVPGIHRFCHQDWRGTHNGQVKIINGGWHDAGDLSQGSHRTGVAVYSMLRIYEQLRERNLRPDLQARVLEEARWGLDWLLKTRFGDGYRITWVLGRYYSDNKLDTIDDMIVPAQHVAFENYLFAAVAAHASRVLKDTDPRRAASSLQAAREDYRATLARRSGWLAAARDEAAFGALASVELFRATGDRTYAADAERFGKLLVQCQEQRFVDGIPMTGYFYTGTGRERIQHDHHMSFEEAPLLALGALCDAFPGHRDWMNWYGAALLHSEFFLRRGAAYSEPYRHLPNSVWRRSEVEALKADPGWDLAGAWQQFNEGTALARDHRLRVFPLWRDKTFHGSTAIQLSATAALSVAAALRGREESERLAGRQLDWVFGGNPFSQSLMYGEGYDFQPHFAYCQRDMVGALPVGIDSRRNDAPIWPATNTATYKEIWVVPVSRLLLSLGYAAVPARVSGAAPRGAVFREERGGAEVRIPAGKFSLNLSPGGYTVSYGGFTQRLHLPAGTSRELHLDARQALHVALSAESAGPSVVRVKALVRGAGSHRIRLLPFNAKTGETEKAVDLGTGGDRTLTWMLEAGSRDTPWAAVAIADDGRGGRSEIFGTLQLQIVRTSLSSISGSRSKTRMPR